MRRTLMLALLLASAAPLSQALTLRPGGQVRVEGHAAGTFRGFQDVPVGGLAWGPDGTAYTLDGTGLLYRWDARTGRALSRRVLTPPAALQSAGERFGHSFKLDGYRAGGAVTGPFIRVQGQRKGHPYQTAFTLTAGGRAVLGDPFPFSPVRVSGRSASGRFVARVEGRRVDKQARISTQDRQRPERSTTVTLPTGQVRALEPSPDGAHVAALRLVEGQAPAWGAVWWLDLWDVKAGRVSSRQVSDHTASEAPLAQVHWVDAGRLLTATGGENGPGGSTRHTLRLWNLKGVGPLWTRGQQESLEGAWPSPDGQLFLTVRAGSLPELHRVSDGTFVRALGSALTAWTPLSGGRALLALDTGNGQGELRTVERGGASARLGGEREGGVTRLSASPDGRWSALARGEYSGDGGHSQISLLDAAGRTLHTWRSDVMAWHLNFTPDSRRLFARVAADPWSAPWRGLVWDVPGGRLLADRAGTAPVGNVLIKEDRQQPKGQNQSRLTALDTAGRVLWQERQRTDWLPDWRPSLDGRTLVRAFGQSISGFPERRSLNLVRVDPRTGAVSPGLTLSPAATDSDPYRSLRLLQVAPDRRHVLLGESSGDGCGASFYSLRLADLGARREVALPAAFTRNLARDSGCGLPVPFPEVAFSPDGKHLLLRAPTAQEGNTLTWQVLRPE